MSIELTNESLLPSNQDEKPIPLSQWFVALLISTVIAWVGYNFLPLRSEMPSHLIGVNAMSPKEIQAEAAEKEGPLFRWNSLVTLACVGFCMGAACLLLSPFKPLRVLACTGVGVIAGGLASFLGVAAKGYFNKDLPIPMIDDSLRPMVVDIAIYSLLSTILCIPLAFVFRMYGSPAQRKLSTGIVLAGMIVGCLLPILLSVAVPTLKTDVFPPAGSVLTLTWLTAISLVVFALSRPSNRKPKVAKA